MSHYKKGNRSRANKSIFCRYACPQNPHLRIVNCGFSFIDQPQNLSNYSILFWVGLDILASGQRNSKFKIRFRVGVNGLKIN